ncbi:DNA gyrase subunit A [Companilactobacillus versmoldensis]|uniref:DNA gyrase subunit A n=1 Tax=Companilactobacillus versmoldensis DSM 14857 = KCTC 3814 TaxID=1423815 RepID=A0A0R1SDY5_9LACO|nr:DNA gyrase subunit A [Companilactobacillus versmoldensis]KRL67260.1 DNA gyrase subunit A [Companilactobacillus versmoldensis DSM 14857 = KCTC 3814]
MDDRRIENVNLTEVMKSSFVDYAASVIVSRALPDVRDGLKPVHRRILYGMNELGVTPDKPYKKSARFVGDIMGKYHPHGDSAIYESMVRMAQDFSYRYPLVDGHGNFGSIDGDPPAAMRYTEARMSKMAVEMLRDINKDTVDLVPNYDGEEKEPMVLPARFPNLLVNGATGIAVGMTTNIPSHNLKEVIDALHILMRNKDATLMDLMKVIPGPDFATGGIIMGRSGIRQAYETGKGTITLRAKVDVTTKKNGGEQIIVTELPYMVNKATLVERIADLAREKKIEGITDLNDESDREGMRIVIDVRRDMSASVILNNLYKLTQLQISYGINMVAIVGKTPKVFSLKGVLLEYLKHQEVVIRRRTQYELRRAEARAHILEGLRIALDHIDEIIKIIRGSQTSAIAKQTLIDNFKLSDKQSQAILDMRLVRLTGLEREKVESEYQDLLTKIADFKDILAKPERVDKIIYDELLDIQEKFGDARRTEIRASEISNIEDEDLIEEENILVVLTHNGYIKRLSADEFRVQNRGGRGIQGMGVHDDDFIEQIIYTSTHDRLLFFTNTGKVYRTKGYEVPEYGRTAKGIPVINLLNIEKGESIQTVINVGKDVDVDNSFLFFVTQLGTVKRTPVSDFANIRHSGLRAIALKDEDELTNVFMTDGEKIIFIGTHKGYAVTFRETDVRPMGRTAAGVRGIKLRDEDYVVGSSILESNQEVLTISEHGYGKRTSASEYPVKGRGGKGIKTANVTEKNGPIAGIATVDGDEDIMLVTNTGVMIRFDVNNVSQTGRATLGVRLIKVDDDAFVSTMAKIAHQDEEEEDENSDSKPDDQATTDSDSGDDSSSTDSDDSTESNDSDDTTPDTDNNDSGSDNPEA